MQGANYPTTAAPATIQPQLPIIRFLHCSECQMGIYLKYIFILHMTVLGMEMSAP